MVSAATVYPTLLRKLQNELMKCCSHDKLKKKTLGLSKNTHFRILNILSRKLNIYCEKNSCVCFQISKILIELPQRSQNFA